MDHIGQIEAMLAERQRTHGNFSIVAQVAREAAGVFCKVGYFERPQHAVAVQMILIKLARIAVGDADHVDSWLDIAGYAVLAAKSIPASPEE